MDDSYPPLPNTILWTNLIFLEQCAFDSSQKIGNSKWYFVFAAWTLLFSRIFQRKIRQIKVMFFGFFFHFDIFREFELMLKNWEIEVIWYLFWNLMFSPDFSKKSVKSKLKREFDWSNSFDFDTSCFTGFFKNIFHDLI